MGAKTKAEHAYLIKSVVEQILESTDVEELSPRVITAYLGTLTAFVASIMATLGMEANCDIES